MAGALRHVNYCYAISALSVVFGYTRIKPKWDTLFWPWP